MAELAAALLVLCAGDSQAVTEWMKLCQDTCLSADS